MAGATISAVQSVHQLLSDAAAVEHEVAALTVEALTWNLGVVRLVQAVAEGEAGPWRKRAACAGKVEVMFPGRGRSLSPAVALCERCEVLAECRSWGDATPGQVGVVAGRSERGRRTRPA